MLRAGEGRFRHPISLNSIGRYDDVNQSSYPYNARKACSASQSPSTMILRRSLSAIIAARGYANRSEAIRDLARSGLQQHAMAAAGRQQCLAGLITSTTITNGTTEAANPRFHDHHDSRRRRFTSTWTTRAAWQVTVLKGPGEDVRELPITSLPNAACGTASSFHLPATILMSQRTATAIHTAIVRHAENDV